MCRWDGREISDSFIEKLKEDVEFIPVCPELAVGLGVPRDPSRLVRKGEGLSFLQTNTKKDMSKAMKNFASKTLNSVKEINGFILKDHSPSCGIGNADVYPSLSSKEPISTANGLFASEILKRFPQTPVVTEKMLANNKNREEFLDKIWKR